MAKAIDEANKYLAPQNVTVKDNLVFQSEWENLDKRHRAKCCKQCGGNHTAGTEKRNTNLP